MDSQNSQAVVLLTGASSGIGHILAKKLWQSNYRVVITARSSSLSKIAQDPFQENKRFMIRSLDVSIAHERETLIQEIISCWGGVDILINNAAISYRSVIEHMSEDDELLQLKTNFIGPMELIRLVLPLMRKKRAGRIVNISSVSGMMAMPTMGSYSASKFALEGASEALWYEVRHWNIYVSLVQPGFVHSKSFKRVFFSKKATQALSEKNNPYSLCYHHMGEFIERLMTTAYATPESIADKILKTIKLRSPPLRIPATIDAYFFSLIRRIFPRRFYHWVLYRNLPGINQWRQFSEETKLNGDK